MAPSAESSPESPTFDAIASLMTKDQVRRLRDVEPAAAADDTETTVEQPVEAAVENEPGEAEAS